MLATDRRSTPDGVQGLRHQAATRAFRSPWPRDAIRFERRSVGQLDTATEFLRLDVNRFADDEPRRDGCSVTRPCQVLLRNGTQIVAVGLSGNEPFAKIDLRHRFELG